MIFKFLNWNLWFGKNWKKEIDLIRKFDPDVFTLQEVTKNMPKFGLRNTDVFEEFRRSFPDYDGIYSAQTVRHKNGKEVGHGNAIFSKFKAVDSNTHYLVKKLDWTKSYENQATNLLEYCVKLGGVNTSIFTTHLNYSDHFRDSEIKIKEVGKLVSVLEDRKNFILSGDFNSPPNSLVIEKVKEVARDVDPSGNATWTKHPFSYRGFTEDKLRWKLDYIFASENIKCLDYRLIDSGLSDHLPIVARFEMRK